MINGFLMGSLGITLLISFFFFQSFFRGYLMTIYYYWKDLLNLGLFAKYFNYS